MANFTLCVFDLQKLLAAFFRVLYIYNVIGDMQILFYISSVSGSLGPKYTWCRQDILEGRNLKNYLLVFLLAYMEIYIYIHIYVYTHTERHTLHTLFWIRQGCWTHPFLHYIVPWVMGNNKKILFQKIFIHILFFTK